MIMLRNITFIIFYCITSVLIAQNVKQKEVTITGQVLDKETKQPLEYATIAFFNKSLNKIETGGITDGNGNFSIPINTGLYDISIEYISFKTIKLLNRNITKSENIGVFSLELDTETLDAVEIVAEKTTVDIRLDKKIYNIGKDLTTAGGTVSDALNNVPSVSVDVEGGISLRGNENVRILINGKPSALAGFGDSNILSQLPADAIERVEVITSPSARYDAEGTAGILNIILRKKEILGFNGALNLTAGQPDNVGLSANLNFRTEKFNIFSNIGYRYFDAPRTNYTDITYFDRVVDGTTISPEYQRIIEDEDVTRLNRNYNANVGVEYFLSEKTSITGSLFYRYGEDADLSKNNSDRFNNEAIVERTLRNERQNEEDNSYQISLNYITKFNDDGHELTADFQYENDAENQRLNIDEAYVFTDKTDPDPFQNERVFATEDQTEYLIQADYVLPIGENARFEAGYRGRFENEITDYNLEQENLQDNTFFVNDTISNVFDYTQNVNAFYTQYGTKFGKFSFLLGLRLENTQLKGKIDSRLTDEELEEAFGFPIETDFDNNFLGLFPTLNIIYNLRPEDSDIEESITFGYNRRINRPRGWFLNPFPSRSSRTNVFQGNPNLDPAFASTFDLGYLKRLDKITLTTSIYYQYETGAFERIRENTGQQTSDGIDIIRRIPVNLSTNERTGGEFGILYNPNDWLRLNSSFNIFQFKTKGQFNGVDYGANNLSWFTRFSGKVTLPYAIDWQTNAYYMGPRQNAQNKTKGLFSMDVAFSKEVFKDKATLSLNVRDVFNSRILRRTTETESFFSNNESQWRVRQINLSLLYRFNQQKKRSRSDFEDNEFDEEG
ncbi:outer membrane receptor protein involved in Fe transport [Jejuia pallidilutea]|uniref:Outer membrane receptor protein involved in Fe transport n=1 Tax=Jejuia pallidilutea TaxID=504487 RepID=A0A362XE98_9FLAO|nr:TonB-dependent receptor [Jejuia pallidilutea]PQV50190.1 outer membrane receptor protein involved in Fe transport [Jejuia pallidilutea]